MPESIFEVSIGEPLQAANSLAPLRESKVSESVQTRVHFDENSVLARRSFSLHRAVTSLLQPDRKVGATPGIPKQLRNLFISSKFNFLLVFIPVSWAVHFLVHDSTVLITVFSALALLPLIKLLQFTNREVGMRVGNLLANFLSAMVENIVDFLISMIALAHCELQLVQSALIGAILSNLLFIPGVCFLVGGIYWYQQGFDRVIAQVNGVILAFFASVLLLLPGVAYFDQRLTLTEDILKMSRGIAFLLLFVYSSYMIFQFYSHANSLDRYESQKYADRQNQSANTEDLEEDDPVKPELGVSMSLLTWMIVIGLIAYTAEILVDSVNRLVLHRHPPLEFVRVIILPLIKGVVHAVDAAGITMENKLSETFVVTVGSSIQLAICTLPFMVLLGWTLNKPVTLLFNVHECFALFAAVILLNRNLQFQRSNWFTGLMLLCLYGLSALMFWFFPGPATALTC